MGRLAGSIILLSGWRRALVAMFAGAILVLTQAPYDFFAAGFISFPVLVWLLDGAAAATAPGLIVRFRPAFAVGWWFGFGYFLAGLWWIGSALLVEAESFAWALPLAVIGIPLLLAFFFGFATAMARLLWSDGLGRIVALAFGFGLTEWLRTFVLTGFPWNPVGFGAMPVPLLMQSVELVGTSGMNVLAVFVFASPALLAIGRGAVPGLAISAILVTLHAGYGAWALSQPVAVSGQAFTVRIVQPNVDLTEKWDARDRIFKSLLDLSADKEGDRPDLIVWPETSVPFILSRNPAALAAIGDLLQDGQTLVAGAVREEGATPENALYYNAVVQIDDKGQIVDAVDKNHLVPFGEYLPFADLLARLGLRQLIAGPMNYAPGSQRHPLQLPGALLAPYICYEIIFPELMPAADGPENVILNVTNDAWFGNTPGPFQHLRQAQIRSVETQKPLLRAANTGISAMIDAKGRIVDALALESQGVIDVSVTPAGIRAAPFGDSGRNGLLIIALVALAAAALRIRAMLVN
jgi:apolipoprotein N-acyltransferase